MRVVGYVRESADPTNGRTAFAQQEELRRHVGEHGLHLVSICQDVRVPGRPLARDGYLSLLGVIASGAADAVLLPGVATLSSDQVVQEIMLWDLRARGIRVLTTDADEISLIGDGDPGAARMMIRDILERVGEHARTLGAHRIDPPTVLPDGDVMVHIIAADEAEESSGDDG